MLIVEGAYVRQESLSGVIWVHSDQIRKLPLNLSLGIIDNIFVAIDIPFAKVCTLPRRSHGLQTETPS